MYLVIIVKDENFDKLCLFNNAHVEEVGTPKNCSNCKRAEKPKTVCHKIEPNLSKDRTTHDGDNLSFRDEL
jgi:hypothetical protein